MSKQAVLLAASLVGLWLVLTRSYAGYKGQETDSVADRLENKKSFRASV
jgi:hypothetical protein